ncbi:MarR family winged helix-turn-helix transcriptional regulator [Sphingomonas sp.]|jgi:DNA-binding MarR family transcriptional regulator|uniref:MarR family winged helix-turn-helix transcriptional regulator n=1 Tax=Sphingomonas sp. TaxID=28214 RepID=UPI002DEE1BC4|nr:MarR family winged helix-turn-helix transcriptional regulator [Sphingomonas sp.]
MAKAMASFPSALFLREAEVRRGLELMFAGQAELARAVAPILAAANLGRPHQRALYYIGRQPDQTVGALLGKLGVTKQSLNRTLTELLERGLVEARVGRDDRRQRLLRLTESGRALEGELFEAMRERLASAYAKAGQQAVGGFWSVLEGLS